MEIWSLCSRASTTVWLHFLDSGMVIYTTHALTLPVINSNKYCSYSNKNKTKSTFFLCVIIA